MRSWIGRLSAFLINFFIDIQSVRNIRWPKRTKPPETHQHDGRPLYIVVNSQDVSIASSTSHCQPSLAISIHPSPTNNHTLYQIQPNLLIQISIDIAVLCSFYS